MAATFEIALGGARSATRPPNTRLARSFGISDKTLDCIADRRKDDVVDLYVTRRREHV